MDIVNPDFNKLVIKSVATSITTNRHHHVKYSSKVGWGEGKVHVSEIEPGVQVAAACNLPLDYSHIVFAFRTCKKSILFYKAALLYSIYIVIQCK